MILNCTRATLALLNVVALTSCTGGIAATGAEVPTSKELQSAAPPAASRFHSTQDVDVRANVINRPSTFHDALSALTPTQRDHVATFNARYFGSFQFGTAEEAALLKAHGYPSVAELADLSVLNDADLASIAERGDDKARLVRADRIAQQMERMISILPEGQYTSPEIEAARMVAMTNARMALGDGSNWLAPYVYARVDALETRNPASLAAGLLMATERGDARADNYMQQLTRQHPEMSVAEMQLLYRGMVQFAELYGRTP